MARRFCIDIGGSNVKSAFVDGKKISGYAEFRTPRKESEFLFKLVNLIARNAVAGEIVSIAIASPLKNGVVEEAPHLPIHDFDLRSFLQGKVSNEIHIENDARCAALAQHAFAHDDNFVLLSFGTGVGGAVFLSGKLAQATGYSGELGHMILHGQELEQLWRDKTKDRSYLAEAIVLICASLNPRSIILSSRVIKNKQAFLRALTKSLSRYEFRHGMPRLAWSKLSKAELLGASII